MLSKEQFKKHIEQLKTFESLVDPGDPVAKYGAVSLVGCISDAMGDDCELMQSWYHSAHRLSTQALWELLKLTYPEIEADEENHNIN